MSLETLPPVLALFSGILLASWEIFVEAAPYLIFGFGVAGLLNILVPDQKIVEYLGSSAGKVRSVINASLAGLPLPLCSCGVIPAAMSIRKRGANRGATLSFLISTPQTGVDSIAITYALLDPIMTVFRPIATLVTAILAGLADNLLIGEEEKKKDGKKDDQGKKQACLPSPPSPELQPLLQPRARTAILLAALNAALHAALHAALLAVAVHSKNPNPEKQKLQTP